jgi:hypothetical protein
VLSFAGLAFYLHRENRLLHTDALSLIGIVSAYLLGALCRTIGGWFNRRRTTPPSGTWGDIKAMSVLIVLVLAAIPEFFAQPLGLPQAFHQIALGMMLFYYGSR